MKKLLMSLVAVMLSVACCLGMTACGGVNYTSAKDQISALTEVKAGTADVAVIDSVMANYYMGLSQWSKLQVLTGEEFTFATEDYAIGFRKLANDTSTKDWVDYALYRLQEKGQLANIAALYNLNAVLKAIPEKAEPAAPVAGTDFYDNVINDKFFTIGITEFAPMAIKDDSPGFEGYRGFDCQVAKLVADEFNLIFGLDGDNKIKYSPKIINWNEKENELNAGNIDCIWNGFTVTEERKANICFSEPYMINSQALVIRKADNATFTSYASMKSAKFIAETASAGETTVKNIISKKIAE